MNDVDRINRLGGVSRVAKLLGFSLQRVQNWVGRGAIPPAVKLAYPQHFLFSAHGQLIDLLDKTCPAILRSQDAFEPEGE